MIRLFSVAFVAIVFACADPSANAGQLVPRSALGSLPAVELSQLSQQDRNPLGATAVAIHPEDWKHGETDHFIYHFVHSYVSTPISVEAEFYWRVVAQELGKSETTPQEKSHIYIFESAEDWKAFQVGAVLEPWTGGIQSDGSLFIVRDPSYKFADNSLGHEIAHLVLYRFYGRGIPLWLNEGFAEYISKSAHASFQRARGYAAKPRSDSIATSKLFPLRELSTMHYPPADQVEAFYTESERLVRFLASVDKRAFLTFLDQLARGEMFDSAMLRNYGSKFARVELLEQEFQSYASKDAAGNGL
jgi:hypothetical protein